jgi:hypothetical protein
MNVEMEERLLDLLYKQAVSGLSDEESRQLDDLEKAAGSIVDARSVEFTAAAISMVGLDTSEQMPEHLKVKVLADAKKYFAEAGSSEPVAENVFTRPRIEVVDEVPRSPWWNWLGWAVAAAACVALAVNLYVTRTGQYYAGPSVTPTPVPEERLTPGQQRQRLIETAGDLTRAGWAPGNVKDSTQVEGDVVWSDAKQAGYLRLRGVPVNDPAKETYQLWIFDETQDERTPIDGGTFDINSSGEVIVTINAKLKAKKPKAFAITVEKPGGVVVSKREKVAALAPVKPDQV